MTSQFHHEPLSGTTTFAVGAFKLVIISLYYYAY